MKIFQMSITRTISLLICTLMFLGSGNVFADDFPRNLDGDIGLGSYFAAGIVRGVNDRVSVLPYADFNYRRLFARVDTLGIKMIPVGYGYLEFVGRISMDGFNPNISELDGLHSRDIPIPLGVGTLQVTPVGGLMFNVFHDVRLSKGNWLELIYGGKWVMQNVTVYPLLGTEYQSGEYVRYYYGISDQEAAASQYVAYQPGETINSYIGLIADFKLTDEYHLHGYVRHKRLGEAIRRSPIVGQRYQDTGYIALSYRFK